MRELLIGCGARRDRLGGGSWGDLVTLDHNPDHRPDIEWDLTKIPLPVDDESFDEIHAYEVLEHTGQQGDWRFFFAQFSDFWRILRPGGQIVATVPAWDGIWAWGDPSHSRVINEGTLLFLSQEQYAEQVGFTPMTDFRRWYRADFASVNTYKDENTLVFVLRAVKPSRISL